MFFKKTIPSVRTAPLLSIRGIVRPHLAIKEKHPLFIGIIRALVIDTLGNAVLCCTLGQHNGAIATPDAVEYPIRSTYQKKPLT